MTIDAMICVQNYHKRYGDTLAVENLSFDVSAGSILEMLGPNGAGKTTTLRAIAGIIRPTGGHLRVDGRDVTSELVEAKKNIAFVPDDPQLIRSADSLGAFGIHCHDLSCGGLRRASRGIA